MLRDGIVNNANIAQRAGLIDIEFMLLIQQHHIDIISHLHITGHAQNFLLSPRHRTDTLIELLLFLQYRTFF